MKAPVIAALVIVPVLAVAAAWWASSGNVDESLRAELDALRQRVADLERQDEARVTAQRAAERHVAQLEERVVEAELREAASAAGGGTTPGPSAAADGDLPLRLEDIPAREALLKAAQDARDKAQSDQFGASLRAMKDSVKGLKTSLVAMRLRQLPEDERWKRAMKDVGLNENQVAHLKRAYDDRDVAYADATVTEKSQDDEGVWVVTTKVDAQIVADADRAHASAVHGVMTDDQRESWTDLGFAGAFGRSRPSNATHRFPPKR